jgi:hypothetical protein
MAARIGEVEKLLFVRGVLSPAGHGAWTGLVWDSAASV